MHGILRTPEGESPEDFDRCSCGGKLKYITSLEDVDKQGQVENTTVCPDCSAQNKRNSERCIKCGRNLRKTLFYADGKVSFMDGSDIEITENSLIEYKKNFFFGKRSGQIKEYHLDEMGDILINNRMQRLCSPIPFPYVSLEFDYGERRKSVYILEKYVTNLIKTLNVLNLQYEDYYHFKSL